MEPSRAETGREEVKPAGEAAVALMKPSSLDRARLGGEKRRTITPFPVNKGRHLSTSTVLVAFLATALMLVVGVTVMMLQNRKRLRSRISSETSGHAATGPASGQARASLDSRCMAILAAKEARFFSKVMKQADGHTAGEGQAQRRLSGKGGLGSSGLAEVSAEEELKCVVQMSLVRSLSQARHGGGQLPLLAVRAR